jgi:ADP-ribose pyrophosphatase
MKYINNLIGEKMNIPELEEKFVSSERIFDGHIISLSVDTVTLPNGAQATREVVHHPGAVCVVPLTDEGEVICVRQFRYPFSRVTVEIPAGKLDSKDEDPREAALRELREETGAVCESLEFIGELYSSPAILSETIHMYLATGLSFGECDPDDDEFLAVTRIPLHELVEKIISGEICDAKTQAAVLKTYVKKELGK